MEQDPFVEVHPEDARSLGLQDGATVVVRTEAGEAELPLRVTPTVAPGAAFVPFNQPGLAANVLLSGAFHAVARIETAVTDADAQIADAPSVVGSAG
jgi:anaerobic selenocysteine-containing dehydrogenase